MRRAVWIWVAVAFVAGLLPGGAATAYLWRSGRAARAVLVDRNAQLHADNQALQARLNSAEASVSVLTRKLDEAGAQSAVVAATSGGSSGPAPTGPPNIYQRSVSPTDAVAGKPLVLTVKLTGRAQIAKMRIYGGPGDKFDKTYNLARESYDGSGEVWQVEIAAPSAAGQYHCVGIAEDAAKVPHRTSPGAFTVK